MFLASLSVGLAVAAGLLAVAPRLLLRWYLREVRRMEVPQEHGDAIVTYPLA
jgi:hypothetical protein